MSLDFNALVAICLAYVALLFLIAWVAERRAADGRGGFLRSPLVYTLSLSVYCTAWTFYGAVGSAARNGLEFVTIYLGPTLVFVGWWWLLRRLVRVGQAQRVTSIADLLSARYGKSNVIAVLVTLLAVTASTPYIALQLQSLTLSFEVLAPGAGDGPAYIGLWAAIGLAIFTIIFGTRNIDANERHHGVVMAIAFEAVVKLTAILAVGAFVVWGVADGVGDILARVEADPAFARDVFSARWVTLTFLSATAIICLPRMFQVAVVENADEGHLATASWAFPLYLALMSLFVAPIAVVGAGMMPEGANPDLYVLSVPLAMDQGGLAIFAFIGGFSAATSMVIVAAIALSTMVSNHIVMPLWLRLAQDQTPHSDDVKSLLIQSRRVSIGVILALGYLYFRLTGGTGALASIGLIAFLGAAQVLPALLGGLFWPGATRLGALAGTAVGLVLWAYTFFLPSFGGGPILSAEALAGGPFGIAALTPQALLGLNFDDPLIHATVWSLGANALVFVSVSLLSFPQPMERLQGLLFTNQAVRTGPMTGRGARPEDLLILAQRVLGREEGMRLFRDTAAAQGKIAGLPDPTEEFIATLERRFAGSVGSATAHAMIAQVAGGEPVSVQDLIAMADETAQIMEYSARLEAQSQELSATAEELRAANAKLTEISAQKDDFLSQVSHELRTPMTSIRSFAEILRDDAGMDPAQHARFARIIHDESVRLTRLLDEILDLSFLEAGRAKMNIAPTALTEVIDRALAATETLRKERRVRIYWEDDGADIRLNTDFDRLAQVFINLIANAAKHGRSANPIVRITARVEDGDMVVDVADNGPGVPREKQAVIFEKFARLSAEHSSGSVGLGLPISREIMRNLGGELGYAGGEAGAVFRVRAPLAAAPAPAAETASAIS